MASQPSAIHGRPTLEEEKRRELVIQTLAQCAVSRFDSDVVDTLSRWIAQESKAAQQDKRSELLSRGVPVDAVSNLVLHSLGVERSSKH